MHASVSSSLKSRYWVAWMNPSMCKTVKVCELKYSRGMLMSVKPICLRSWLICAEQLPFGRESLWLKCYRNPPLETHERFSDGRPSRRESSLIWVRIKVTEKSFQTLFQDLVKNNRFGVMSFVS